MLYGLIGIGVAAVALACWIAYELRHAPTIEDDGTQPFRHRNYTFEEN